MRFALALAALLWPSVALAAGDEGGALSGGPLAAVIAAGIAALAGFAGTVVQTRAARAARSALAAGDRATEVGARQALVDLSRLRDRARAAREGGAAACLTFATEIETEAARGECGGCAATRVEARDTIDALRAELAKERADAREELRANLERVLPALAGATTVGHEQAEAMAALVAQLSALVAELRVRP